MAGDTGRRFDVGTFAAAPAGDADARLAIRAIFLRREARRLRMLETTIQLLA